MKTRFEMRKEILRRAIALSKTEEEVWDELNFYRKRMAMQEKSRPIEPIRQTVLRWLKKWGKELHLVKDVEFESPIEETLWMALKKEKIDFEYQKWIGSYRVDFFLPSNKMKLIVEVLGRDYHSSWEQQRRDMARKRYLQGQGYMVLEYPGSDINRDVFKCVGEIKSFL